MKSVLISIQPYWVFLIIAKKMGWNIDKEKTVEVRKSYPKDENWDKVAKIYCSKNKEYFSKIPKEYQPFIEKFLGKVVGEFVCDKLVWVVSHPSIFAGHPLLFQKAIEDACLTEDEAEKYSSGKDVYGWHISDLVIYDKPRELSEFKTVCEGLKPYQCDKCEYSYTESNESIGVYHGCGCDNLKPLKRPFQSWGYVYETDT